MTSLLIVEASPRGKNSVSHHLTGEFLKRWRERVQGDKITYRNLNEVSIPYITSSWLSAYFTPPEHHTDDMKHVLFQSDLFTKELLEADHLVISTPVYNYNVPAVLKSWIDNIVRKGVTLGFDGKGLIENKTATIIVASGGDYSEGSPIQNRDIAQQYLVMILKILGFENVLLIAGGNAKKVDMGEISMDDFIADFDAVIHQRVVDVIKK